MICGTMVGWNEKAGFVVSTQTHAHTHTHFAMLTNADGKTHAVTLIAYKLLWMVGHNVINLALYG